MAKYRQVHVHIWKDDWFLDLDPLHKLFFIYLFTNERASISGIYELSKRVMAFESGLTFTEIDAALQAFEQEGKAHYDDGVVWIPNLRKYHESKSPKVVTFIEEDVRRLRNCKLKSIYMEKYHMDTVSIGYTDNIDTIRSSSRDSSSDSSRNSDKRYEHPPADTPSAEFYQKRNDMVLAINEVVREQVVFGTDSEEKFKRVAEMCIDAGDTPDDIKRGAALWDKKTDKPYEGAPWLKSFVAVMKEYRQSGRKVSSGGVNPDGSIGKYDWSAT